MKNCVLSALLFVAYSTFARAESHAMEMPAAVELIAGDLSLTGAFTRATLPNAPVAGGFLDISNNGAVDDRLISAVSPISMVTQIHEMAMGGDVMKMRELPDGLVIPAGETVNLKPGGYHVMFMDITGPLAEGETIKVRLTFEIAGEVDIYMPVGAPNAKMSGMQMHGMPKASE